MSTYSAEHIRFLKKKRHEKRLILTVQIMIIVLFLLLWETVARLGIINTFLLSSPSDVVKTAISLFHEGTLFTHIWITTYETILSFLIATVLGFIVATLLWSSKRLAKIIDPYLTILNSLPKVALGPLIIIWVGASIHSIIFMALLISTFITIINIYNGFMETEENYIRLLSSFGATRRQIFLKVIIPSNYNTLINALKINISMSLIGVIMGELLVSKQGLGYLIMYGSQVFNINLVITAVFLLGLLSYLMYFSISKLDQLFKK